MRRPIFIARQGRCPQGILGKIIAHIMVLETASANDFTLELLELSPQDQVLELGVGHGETLKKAAAVVTDGFLAGIDHSEVMIAMARKRNEQPLKSGRVALHLGDSLDIPYADRRFDKVYGVHTVYFWDDLEAHLREIFRVIAPNGRLVLAYRPKDDVGFESNFPDSIYCIRSMQTIESALQACGFSSIHTHTQGKAEHLLVYTVSFKAS